MATVSTFLASYPEFAGAETDAPGLIQTKLDAAARATNGAIMGDVTDDVIELRTAIALMRSPWARALRLEQPDQLKMWQDQIDAHETARTSCIRIFP